MRDERKLARFLRLRAQFFLPLVELVGQCQMAVEDWIDRVGRATVEAAPYLLAVEVAGEPQQGQRRREAIGWHGRQSGSVYLREQKLRVAKPRLRRRGSGPGGEVSIPAYEELQQPGPMAARMLELVLRGVSMRNYAPAEAGDLPDHGGLADAGDHGDLGARGTTGKRCGSSPPPTGWRRAR